LTLVATGAPSYISRMDDGEILVEEQAGICRLTLSRPARKNALTLKMYDELARALGKAAGDPSARVVLVRGAGGSFTSGNDLGDFMRSPPSGEDSPVFRFLAQLVAFEKPLVAQVEGHAIGIGTTLLLHCDLVYASESARLQLPFVNLGLVPEAASSLLLPRIVGHARAAELLYFGEPFDAHTAHALGLVNAVLPVEKLAGEVDARLRKLAEKPPAALRETKRLLKAGAADDVRARMGLEGASFVERLRSPEVAEAIAAFFEKRKPDFSRFA